MRAILLSAGYGTRLLPLTRSTPKCLVDINGKPLLGYWLELLVNGGVDEILVNTHFLSEQVGEYVANSAYANRVTLVYEEVLLNTGGTILKNGDFFKGDGLMVIHADNLSNFNVSEFINTYSNRSKKIEITMMTFKSDDPESCGVVSLDEHGVVCGFHEKIKNPPGDICNGAVYIISKEVLKFLENMGKENIDFSIDVLPNFLGKINTFYNNIYHRDIGTLKSLEIARKDYLSPNKCLIKKI